MRRDFTDLAYDGFGPRVLMEALLPVAALLAFTVGVIAGTTPASRSVIDTAKLERSLATAFSVDLLTPASPG
jgi:ABC-2 type transport system permease protein